MNSYESQQLDRHITGNYGEDQMKGECLPSPGPWQLGPNGVDVRDCTGENICTVPYSEDDELAEANARLIAAAPDLLEALKLAQPIIEARALEGPGGNTVAEQVRDVIRAAIAKANGK